MTGAEQARALALLREGTEVLRTGGGTELTAPQCNAVLDHIAAAEAALRETREALRAIVREYDLWSEDANDGEFRLWDLDRLVMAIVNARAALARAGEQT